MDSKVQFFLDEANPVFRFIKVILVFFQKFFLEFSDFQT